MVAAPGRGERGFEVVGTIEASDGRRAARRAPLPRVTLHEYGVFDGARPHDVAPARDGSVWFTAQAAGEIGSSTSAPAAAAASGSARAQRRTA